MDRIAVVIPCRNEASHLRSLLDALAAQTRAPDEVVIVDDRSTDGTAAIATEWGRAHPVLPVRVIEGAGKGAGPAMNAGIRATEADVIVRLDGHCRPDPSYIARCLETLQADNAGIAGGVWQIEPGAPTPMARGIAAVLSHPLGSGGADYRTPDKSASGIKEVDTVPFGTFSKGVWSEVGGFDESLVRNQDYDFNYRVRLTGRKVLLNPRIVTTYNARPTLAALGRQYFDYGFWKVVMLRKFPASIRVRQLAPLLLFPAIVILLLWAATGSLMPIVLLAAYLAVNLAGAVQASATARDWRAVPFAFAALLTLQTAWSAGASMSLLSGARASRR